MALCEGCQEPVCPGCLRVVAPGVAVSEGAYLCAVCAVLPMREGGVLHVPPALAPVLERLAL